ncbi:MAG: hypothetical protein RLZZ494_308, partial [Pseudomonadota bacterium]
MMRRSLILAALAVLSSAPALAQQKVLPTPQSQLG